MAKRLAADDFHTVVNYASSAAEADEVVAVIKAAGGRAIAIRAEVADASAMKMLFDQAEAVFGPVDVLVNNDGILKVSPLSEVAEEDYQRLIAVNLTGTFKGMREGARRVRDGGRIVNFSTSIIGNYLPNYGVYVATKAAVEAMTHVLAKELGHRGVTVNVVAPGPVATELFPSLMNRNQTGCSIATRRHDSRGCYGKRTCGTLRRPDWRGAVLP